MTGHWLHPIELIGIGTEDVECLSSYLIRASIALGLSPGQLLSHTKNRYLAHIDSEREDFTFNITLNNYYRPNRSTEMLVKSLDAGTPLPGAGFRRGTFLSLKNAIVRSPGIFSSDIRWCPVCFQEFERLNDKGYFKLIWQLQAVTHCHIHAVPLGQRCHYCNKSQNSLEYRARCLDCAHCKRPITPPSSSFEQDVNAVAKFSDIRTLVKETASDADLSYPSGGVRSLLEMLFDEFWSRGDDLKMWKVIPRDEYLTIIQGMKPITFGTARSIAFRFGLSLPELLRGRLRHTTHTLDPAWTENIPKEFKPVQRKTFHDPAVLEKGLKQALSVPERECKSLKQVATDLGVTEGCLRNRFPSTCEQIVKRNQQRLQAEEMKLRMRVIAAVTGYLAKHKIGSSTPHGIVTTIWRETALPRERIRNVVQEFQNFIQPSGKAPVKPTRKRRSVEPTTTT